MTRVRPLASSALVVVSAFARLAAAAPNDAAPAPAPAAPTPPTATAPAPAAAPAPAPAPAAAPPPAAPTPPATTAPAAAAAPAPSVTASTTLVPTAAAAPPATEQPSDGTPVATSERPKVPSSLEVSLAFGPTVVGGETANPQYNPTLSRIGAFGELGVAYRSSYFIDPFIAVGYATLARGEAHLPAGEWGAGGTLEQSLGAWTIAPGLTADIWRFRPRFALGIALVKQHYSFHGEDTTATQTPLMTQLGLGFVAHNGPRFRLDIEARAVIISGAEVNFGTLDLILRADAIYFGGG